MKKIIAYINKDNLRYYLERTEKYRSLLVHPSILSVDDIKVEIKPVKKKKK